MMATAHYLAPQPRAEGQERDGKFTVEIGRKFTTKFPHWPSLSHFSSVFTGFSTPLKFGRGGGKAQVRVRHACNPLPFALGLPATMSARCLGGIASRF